MSANARRLSFLSFKVSTEKSWRFVIVEISIRRWARRETNRGEIKESILFNDLSNVRCLVEREIATFLRYSYRLTFHNTDARQSRGTRVTRWKLLKNRDRE